MSLILWGGDDPFTHTIIFGPTRCGKTSTLLKPLIFQILLAKLRGIPVGLSVIEPKGDLARMVAEMSKEMELPYTYIDPDKEETDAFNPMIGDIDDVAEATVAVLQGLFGKQEAFFRTVQELSSRNVTKLLKELQGNDLDLMDVIQTLRDPELLEARVNLLEQRKGQSDLTQFFKAELLGTLRDQYYRFVIGLRAQLENITGNRHLKKIMSGRNSINIDEHFANGGIFAVNTSMGKLRKAGDAFGQFVIMHLQSGTFRRPGTERTRVPHFLIVDEYSRYINPDVELFLSIAAEYRVAGVFATQSLGQLEMESGQISARAMKKAILTSCRNKIAFGGLSWEDAEEMAKEFGKKKIIMRQASYKTKMIMPNLYPSDFRDTEQEVFRFDPTFLMDGMPRFHFVYKLLQDGHPQPPALGKGQFIPKNWREQVHQIKREIKGNKSYFVFDQIKHLFHKNERGKGFEIIYSEQPEDEFIPVFENGEETQAVSQGFTFVYTASSQENTQEADPEREPVLNTRSDNFWG
jgi:hypothetical protein